MEHSVAIMDAFAYDIIEKRRDDPKASEYSDLLSRFLTMKADETGRMYADKELRDIVMNMVM
jgi:cytochrome P450